MTVHSVDFDAPLLRRSLKRGLAREVLRRAAASEPDLAGLFKDLGQIRPNAKALERAARRLKRRRGVLRVSLSPTGPCLTLMFRNVRQIQAQSDGVALFEEDELIYTRLVTVPRAGRVLYTIDRLSFCAHALERLVERSDCELANLLSQVDGEAVRGLAQVASGMTIHDGGDCYLTSSEGVWAGSLDWTEPEADWNVVPIEGAEPMPIFSVRTFLGEEEMRPMVWLRWSERTSGIQPDVEPGTALSGPAA